MINPSYWQQMTDFTDQLGWYTAPEYCLALFMEVAELTDSLNWKPWKGEIDDRENLKREIVDCFFFLHHIAVTKGISLQELEEEFRKVLENNERRYLNDNPKRSV